MYVRQRYLGVLLVAFAAVIMTMGCQQKDQGGDAPLMKNAPPPPGRPPGKPTLTPGTALR